MIQKLNSLLASHGACNLQFANGNGNVSITSEQGNPVSALYPNLDLDLAGVENL